MKELHIATRRGSVLYGVLFDAPKKADTVVIAITGIHGNFYSNPFYYNFGDTLNAGGIDFIYAQTNDAMDAVRSRNVVTGKEEIVGSCNERFAWTDEDIGAYLDFAEQAGYIWVAIPSVRTRSFTICPVTTMNGLRSSFFSVLPTSPT